MKGWLKVARGYNFQNSGDEGKIISRSFRASLWTYLIWKGEEMCNDV